MSIALFNDRSRAEPIQKRLNQAGFHAELHEEPTLGALWFTGRGAAGVRLEVPGEEFERAEHLLIDWDATQGALRDAIHCPQCGSLRIEYPQYAEHSVLTNLALGVSAEAGLVEKDYYCQDCHFAWPKPGLRPRPRRHMAPDYFLENVAAGRAEAEAARKARRN
jgi:hypothetical protein